MTRTFVWPPGDEADVPTAYVGVLVERLPDGSVHVGILYRTAGNAAYVLEQFGHYDFRNRSPAPGQLCILCPIEPVLVPTLAAAFRQIYRCNKKPGLPYGFSAPLGDWFSAEGRYVSGADGSGFCCQSFVLAAYQFVGQPIIEPLGAPARADDAERQGALLDKWAEALKAASSNTQAHFAAVRASIGVPLYRPLEVGGAASAEEIPCDFETAVRLAAVINGLLS